MIIKYTRQSGFTLVELLIAITIVAILVAAATPSYQHYLRKARYSEIVQFMSPYKTGVEICYYATGNIKQCELGKYGIPSAQQSDVIQSIIIQQGHIMVIPKEKHGLSNSDTYELKPDQQILEQGAIKWLVDGGAVEKGYVSQY